jgi:glycosyltransferase involved in cell wall biosynthesis
MGNEQSTINNRLVSIIIPSHNSRKWVCDAIDSSLQQTYSHCEVIVVDARSTDNSKTLLQEKYSDKIRYVYQQNRGLAGARNTGIRHAKGEYLQFLDADDTITTDKIERQYSVRGT